MSSQGHRGGEQAAGGRGRLLHDEKVPSREWEGGAPAPGA